MDTKALRQKILDLAIRGKLVPQDPNDEPASVLLERIREKKRQMVKEGKLKAKDIKNDTVIFKGDDNLHYEKFPDGSVKCIEEEIPFELPEGWEWARLRDFVSFVGGSQPAKSTFEYIETPDNIRLIQIRDYKSDKYKTFIPREKARRFCSKSDVMIGRYGPPLFQILRGLEGAYNVALMKAVADPVIMINDYLYYLLQDGALLKMLESLSDRTCGQDGINMFELNQYIVGIPPIDEQERIARYLIDALPLADKLSTLKDDLSELLSQTKSKILDLAIKGRLVPQDPNDEPVSVLLERIKKEKEELIKSGKLKRDKKESVIFKGDDNSYYEKVGEDIRCIDEEVPFELPDSWEYIRLKFAWELVSGRDLSPSEYSSEQSGIPYITGASNFENGQVSLFRWTSVPQVITYKGDLLLTCKGTIGEIALNNFGEAHIARQIMAIRNKYDLNVDFLALCIEYSMSKIKQAAKGLIPGISREDILGLIIPIPPAEQQIEIVRYVHIYRNKLNSILLSLM